MQAGKSKALKITATVIVVLLGVVWWIDRIAAEPSWHGKTATEWLEKLELQTREQHADGIHIILRSPNEITSNPAFHALSAIGARAIPVLKQRITEPAELPKGMPAAARWKIWLRWKWFQVRGPGPAPRPPSGSWPQIQVTRKTAAGFLLLALGTNVNGGFSRFMEAYAAAPRFASTYGAKVAGMPVGVAAYDVVQAAFTALPERRAEVVAEVLSALEHTNAIYRQCALEAARAFPEELLKHKDLLLKLTQDESEYVKAAALGNLLLIVQQPALKEAMPPAEVRQAAEAVLAAASTSERNRAFAQTVVRVADKQSEK